MNEQIANFLILVYCIFQIAGCIFVGRAIYQLVTKAKKEATKETLSDSRRAR